MRQGAELCSGFGRPSPPRGGQRIGWLSQRGWPTPPVGVERPNDYGPPPSGARAERAVRRSGHASAVALKERRDRVGTAGSVVSPDNSASAKPPDDGPRSHPEGVQAPPTD